MKKNTVEFKTTDGKSYTLTRPTAEVRFAITAGLGTTEEEIKSNMVMSSLEYAKAGLPKSIDVDDLPDKDIFEIGARVAELSTLGK